MKTTTSSSLRVGSLLDYQRSGVRHAAWLMAALLAASRVLGADASPVPAKPCCEEKPAAKPAACCEAPQPAAAAASRGIAAGGCVQPPVGKKEACCQDKSAQKSNAILAALKDFGIDEKDIQTVSYNSYPNYEWRNASCPSAVSASISTDGVSSPVYCPPGKQILTGYEVDQTVTVKIRKTDDAGTVLTKVGSLGATNISGLSFVVDNTDALQVEARDKAIVDA